MNVMRIVVTLALCFLSSLACAQYPSKPVRIIVPWSAGGGTDIVVRLAAQEMSENTGKAFIVENRTGAGGRIGYEAAIKAEPDGYTLLAADSSLPTLPALYPSKLSWSTTDVAPITILAQAPFFIVVSAKLKVATLSELLALAKSSPGKLNFGSSGIGSYNHIVTELFMRKANISLTHIPYRGISDAVTAMLGGQVDVLIVGIAALPHIASGKMVPLAAAAVKRSPVLPEVPTALEGGLPGFLAGVWFGLASPRGTPPEIIDWLHREAVRALSSQKVKERLATLMADPSGMTPGEMSIRIREETRQWSEVIRAAGITAE